MNNGQKPNPFVRLPFVRNWISLAGLIVVLGSIFAFVLLLVIDLFSAHQNPYVGILTFVVAPAFFLFGAVVMFLGRILYRRRAARDAGKELRPTLVIDLSQDRHRRYLAAFAVGGLLFLLISAIGSYQTYQVTDSVQFCGEACHKPMEPQFTAYLHSPHAKVDCTECHIGSGAENFIKAKFNGVHQLFAVATDDYEKPIHLSGKIKIDQKTCEQCHWPNRYVGNVERTYNHYLRDKDNTKFSVRLLLKVGGADPTHGPVGGIHWHMNLANKVEYIALDKEQQVIPWVRITDPSGKVSEFRSPKFKDDPSTHQIRTMDCLDCHNRPAHQFRAPAETVDLAMELGEVSTKLPGIKEVAVKALAAPAATQEDGKRQIMQTLMDAYRGQPYPVVRGTIDALSEIYENNFFPEMKVDWRTHPDNIGHKFWPGCFRCHDGQHKTADGKRTLGASDCNSCHIILAQGDPKQFKKLNPDGQPFLHVDAEYSDFSCTECHTGGVMKE